MPVTAVAVTVTGSMIEDTMFVAVMIGGFRLRRKRFRKTFFFGSRLNGIYSSTQGVVAASARNGLVRSSPPSVYPVLSHP